MACSHEAYCWAYEQVNSLTDAERLASDPRCALCYEALVAVLSQKQLARIKRTDKALRERSGTFVERYLAGETLLTLAASEGVPPTKMARYVLERHMGAAKGKGAGALLTAPSRIDDARLRHEVELAVEEDLIAGPRADAARRLVGAEFEELLCQKLDAMDVPYVDEAALVARGEAKTPDALLPVPLLVRGRVVNWIDSKATFGDEQTHAEYAAQFASYTRRFDAGLVVYWFGYDETINAEPTVLCVDDLRPAECALLTCMDAPSTARAAAGGGVRALQRNARLSARFGFSPVSPEDAQPPSPFSPGTLRGLAKAISFDANTEPPQAEPAQTEPAHAKTRAREAGAREAGARSQ